MKGTVDKLLNFMKLTEDEEYDEEYEEYEGQAYPKIKFFNRPGSFRPLEKMDAGHAIAVASSVDAALSAYRLKKGLGKPQTQPQTKQTSTTEADDLPF